MFICEIIIQIKEVFVLFAIKNIIYVSVKDELIVKNKNKHLIINNLCVFLIPHNWVLVGFAKNDTLEN